MLSSPDGTCIGRKLRLEQKRDMFSHGTGDVGETGTAVPVALLDPWCVVLFMERRNEYPPFWWLEWRQKTPSSNLLTMARPVN